MDFFFEIYKERKEVAGTVFIALGLLLIFLPEPVLALPLVPALALAILAIFLIAQGLTLFKEFLLEPRKEKQK